MLLRREPERLSAQQRRRGPWTAMVGLAVVVLMIAGSGLTIVGLMAGCVLVPLPYYSLVLRPRT